MKRYTETNGAYFIVMNWRFKEGDFIPLDFFKDLNVNLIDTLKNAPPGFATMRIPGDTNHPDTRASTHVAQLLLEYFKTHNLIPR